jgi:riboflavin kinase/FMN adenylyltransferase
MQICHSAQELGARTRKACLAIGFFDGVHLGHQQIIRQTTADARQHEAVATVITFDVHPNTIVAPTRVPLLIHSLDRKIRRIESLGADALLLIHFDEAFSHQTGEQFIRRLVADFKSIHSICVGANFVFGHKRSGNVELLKKLGAELGFVVHGLAAVALDGETVSSTRIRQAIAAGDFDTASQMLGRSYSLAGSVGHGDGLGRQLGFPTANIDTTGLVLPPTGVYAAQARAGGQLHRAVLNIGFRPTLQSPQPELRVEAHLLDFDGDLYGQEVEILFVDKIRDEKKFSSLKELRDQIALDILEAQLRF